MTYRQVLAVREFQALFLSQALSLLGDQVTRIAISLLVFDRTGSEFASAATYACSYLSWLVGGPVLSTLSDRYPRRTVMVVCDVGRCLLILLLLVPGLPLWVFFAVLLAVGLLAPPFDSALGSLVPDVLPGDAYAVGNAILHALYQGGQATGFLLGGVLVHQFGTGTALAVDAATFALSAATIALAVRPRASALSTADRGTFLADAFGGAALLARDRRLRVLLAWGLLGAVATIAPEGLAVAVASGQGQGAAAAGVLAASIPIGFLVGSVALLRMVPLERRVARLPWLACLSSVPLLITPLAGNTLSITLLWITAGAGSVVQLIASTEYIAAAPRELRGRAYGIAVASLMAVQAVVLLAAGAAAEQADPRLVVAGMAAVSLLLVPVLAARTATSGPAPAAAPPVPDAPSPAEDLEPRPQATDACGRVTPG